MFIDTHGVGVEAQGGVETTPDVIELARDVAMIRMKAAGATYKDIGRFFRMSPQAVHQRLSRIPPNAREHYRTQPLGWMG